MSSQATNVSPIVMRSTPNQSAILSRLNVSGAFLGLNSTWTNDSLVASDTFAVDSSSPWFYIFAGGVGYQFTDSNGVAFGGTFRSDFQFYNGSVPFDTTSLYWGDPTTLDGTPGTIPPSVRSLIVTPSMVFGPSYFLANDPTSGACIYITPGDATNGVINQWSCLANSVKVSTTLLLSALGQKYAPPDASFSSPALVAPYTLVGVNGKTDPATGGSLYHGVLQQPWSASS